MTTYAQCLGWIRKALRSGLVIPAHPLALTRARKFDERRQMALTRYYHAAGVGGLAVGVHTTQFEIRRPEFSLFKPVLELAATTLSACEAAGGNRLVRIAGICGRTPQALREAQFARDAGYHVGLVSLAAFRDEAESVLIAHCQEVASVLPLFGFYLQPAVGGRVLSIAFWRSFASIPNAVGIKIAAFNRYQTLDVARAVAEVGRAADLALYTGNDDHIVLDLLTTYEIPVSKRRIRVPIVGGLLGHWACWTRAAVRLLDMCKQAREKAVLSAELLTLGAQVTESNAAFFDAANQFAGCIPGIHEVLRRQGLLSNLVCLDPTQRLSPGQRREIDRVCRAYPELNDDAFVSEHLHEWLER